MTNLLRVSLLWMLTLLFMGRVMGQALVGIYQPAWLPPWSEWYSGLLPYPWLLLSQLLLLMFMAVVNTGQAGEGRSFQVTSDVVRRRLRMVGGLYVGLMLLRYGLSMVLMPENRWLGGAIPIVFHLVLAAWMLTLAARKTR